MSIEQANLIWDACYGDDLNSDGWATYTSEQRQLAIQIRQQDHDHQRGCWGVWNISDRD